MQLVSAGSSVLWQTTSPTLPAGQLPQPMEVCWKPVGNAADEEAASSPVEPLLIEEPELDALALLVETDSDRG